MLPSFWQRKRECGWDASIGVKDGSMFENFISLSLLCCCCLLTKSVLDVPLKTEFDIRFHKTGGLAPKHVKTKNNPRLHLKHMGPRWGIPPPCLDFFCSSITLLPLQLRVSPYCHSRLFSLTDEEFQLILNCKFSICVWLFPPSPNSRLVTCP